MTSLATSAPTPIILYPWFESATTKAFSRTVSKTGKLSGVNAPIPPVGAFWYRPRVPSNRL